MDVDDTEPPMEGPGGEPQLYCKPIGVDADDASDADGADASDADVVDDSAWHKDERRSHFNFGRDELKRSTQYFTQERLDRQQTDSSSVRILKSCSKSLVMDLAFVLEGQTPEALPEKILGTVEWNHFDLDPDNSPVIKVCGEDN